MFCNGFICYITWQSIPYRYNYNLPPCIFSTVFPLLSKGLFFHMAVEHSLHYVQINLLSLLTKLLCQLWDSALSLCWQNNVLCLSHLLMKLAIVSTDSHSSSRCLPTHTLNFVLEIEARFRLSENSFLIMKCKKNRKEKMFPLRVISAFTRIVEGPAI